MRDERLSGFMNLSGEYLTPNDLRSHEYMAIDPTFEDMQEYAHIFSNEFMLRGHILLSPDGKTMYGYCAEGLEQLVIPDSVEVYDNIIAHSESETEEFEVVIGKSLKEIVDTANAFGYHNLGFTMTENGFYSGRMENVAKENPYFTVIDGMLYDKAGETLICYPSGVFTFYDQLEQDVELCYIQLPLTTKKIAKHAFYMELLPMVIVIPISVEIVEPHAFCETYDKGLYMRRSDVLSRKIIYPAHLSEQIRSNWVEGAYDCPSLIEY